MSNFSSITQYDKKFDIQSNEIIYGKGYACSLFSILTPWKFMQGHPVDKNTHEQNINDAVKASRFLDMNEGLTFSNLLSTYTNIDANKIIGTCVELIVNKVLGFGEMFPKIDGDSKYAVIFLKNEKYIVVLVDKNGYYVRDCHESVQYNFKDFESVVAYLGDAYQFTTQINVSGIEFSEYSSIEFIRITEKFDTYISSLLSINDDDKLFDSSNNKLFDLNNDIFDLPDGKILTKNDISYLELLNDQLNGLGGYDSDFTKISDNGPAEFVDFD